MEQERQTKHESRQRLLEDELELQDYSEGTSSAVSRPSHEEEYEKNVDEKGPRYNLPKSRLMMLIIAVLVSNFSAAVDTGLSASTHTAVASAFDHTNLQSWPVNAFVVASMTIQPLYGRSSDILGRKIPYLVASTAFAIGIVMCAFAPSWELLIASRMLCGLGSAGITTMGSVVLTDAVGLAKRGYYQSINYAVYGGGSALGSAFGGAVVQHLGWDWVYKTQIPISVLALALLSFLLPAKPVTSDREQPDVGRFEAIFRQFDWLGSVCLMLTLLSLFVFLTLGGNVYPWSHPLVLLFGLATAVAAVCFLYIETCVARPVLPLYLLVKFPARNIMFAGFLTSFVNYTALYNTTLFFQTVHLDSVQDAGFKLLIPSLSFTVASCMTGVITARRKSPTLTLQLGQGFLLVGTSGLVFMAATFRTLSVPDWTYNVMLAIPIIGIGMLASSTVLALLNVTPADDQAVANGCLIMVRSLGVFIATALSTAVLQNTFLAFLRPDQYDEEKQLIIEAVRQNAERLLSVEEPLKLQIILAYEKAFTAVYGTCAVAAVAMIVSLLAVKVGSFGRNKVAG